MTGSRLIVLATGISVSGVETWVWKLATRHSGRGYGAESNRPTTNFPGISVDTNRFDCLVEKSGLDVDPWRLVSRIKQV
mgnify:CR=1 FL=1